MSREDNISPGGARTTADQIVEATPVPSGNKSGIGGLTSDQIKQLVGYGTSAAVQFLGGNDPHIEKAGYQGGIPKYTSLRERVPYTDDPYRRPGSSGNDILLM